LERPSEFVHGEQVTEQELFEESALGVLSSRQSTNFKGHRQVTFGPEDSSAIAELLQQLSGPNEPVLEKSSHTHIFLSRPYRTPFTLLLTFVGHYPLISLLSVPLRGIRKQLQHIDDIPTIGFLQDLHLGILAESVERSAVIASGGKRVANVIMAPFCGPENRKANAAVINQLSQKCGLTSRERMQGWQIAMVAQVGYAPTPVPLDTGLCRKIGANLLAFRSERIQPGVNQEDKAPPAYHQRQDMNVSEDFTIAAGRAAYNAFSHWTGCDREEAKTLLLMDRIDVLTLDGKTRLRKLRQELNDITDRVIANLPLWADLPLMKAFSRNANRGRKAFALAGQRIYVGGLSRPEIERANLNWTLAIRGVGAAAARSSLYCELMGCVDLPDNCDLLGGICLMAGPVNQNDIGKQFYGYADLLAQSHPDRDPTSMLVWTFKAKTVADPIGNEEQLLNAARKGALVDLRTGPHEVVQVCVNSKLVPMRKQAGRVNAERAFGDVGNFVTDPNGTQIPGNTGSDWPKQLREAAVWS